MKFNIIFPVCAAITLTHIYSVAYILCITPAVASAKRSWVNPSGLALVFLNPPGSHENKDLHRWL
jgi:hypothetical protein